MLHVLLLEYSGFDLIIYNFPQMEYFHAGC